MTWYNTNETMSHTYEIQNFDLENDNEVILTARNSISLMESRTLEQMGK